MTEKEYNKVLLKLALGAPLAHEEVQEFIAVVEHMESMLDAGDGDDYYGTVGWRYHFGWSD
jgi:hypothetical protein